MEIQKRILSQKSYGFVKKQKNRKKCLTAEVECAMIILPLQKGSFFCALKSDVTQREAGSARVA